MNIIKYLQSKKIIPSREKIIKDEAKRLAKRITEPGYFLVKLDNKELAEFSREFVDQILEILTLRYISATEEVKATEDSINNLRCNK